MATNNAISNKTGTLTVDNALTVTAGGAAITGASTINGGTVGLGTDNAANAITVGSGTTGRTINVGNSAAPHVVTVGSTNAASQLALQYGTADFTLASATGTVISALDTGEVTKPLQPAFLAILESSDSNVTGTGTSYFLGTSGTALTEISDQGSDFNNATGTFTAPVAGTYWLKCYFRLGGCTISTIGTATLLTSNRAYYRQINRAASALNIDIGVESNCDLDAGDTATFRIQITGEAADTVDVSGVATNCNTWCCGNLKC